VQLQMRDWHGISSEICNYTLRERRVLDYGAW